MNTWDWPLPKLGGLTLAADIRFGQVDYYNDHIWELAVTESEPPALSLQTTFGLRARGFRLFPQFVEEHTTIHDPTLFDRLPIIKYAFANYTKLVYSPLPNIEVAAEYWIPESHAAAGRLCFTNQEEQPRQVRLELAALLTPGETGHRMVGTQIQGVHTLVGESEGLCPLVFMTGGAEAANVPYPALCVALTLDPGVRREIIWVQAALTSPEQSFELAREYAARNWEAETARIQLVNTDQVDIQTGDKDWDIIFALTQQIAHGLLIGPGAALPNPSLVTMRTPDQGYSLRGDGSDYSYPWAGQSPLEVYYLSHLLLPGSLQEIKGLLLNFFAVQDQESGFIDWRPGLAGQRSRLLAQPILASLIWRIYQVDQDKALLEETFDGLLGFIRAWLVDDNDRDGDGVPEWSNSRQMGIEDHPIFDRWFPWSAGADITAVESPSLCSLLYRECQTALRIAEVIGRNEAVPELQAISETLHQAVTACWDAETATFHNRDRDTHLHPAGETLGYLQGSGEIIIQRHFPNPIRPVFRLYITNESTQRPQVTIYGDDAEGQPCLETISLNRWQWSFKSGSVTSEHTFSRLEHIDVQNVTEVASIRVLGLDCTFEDLSLLLPLWAGLLDEETAKVIVENTILNPQRYWLPFGLPLYPPSAQQAMTESAILAEEAIADNGTAQMGNISLPLNLLVAQGLLHYGYRSQAADLYIRLMSAVSQTIRKGKVFRRYYHAETGAGSGERNHLEGLIAPGLFLDILGVTIFSPWRVGLVDKNPFPWPVRLHYRGLTILRESVRTVLTFPDGQIITVDDPKACTVSME